MAAADMYLKIDGIKGDSTDDKHKDEIDLLGWRWSVDQQSSRDVGGGLGSGRAKAGDVRIYAATSKASPLLFLRCATGEHIKEMTLCSRKGVKGGKQDDNLKIKLTNCMITRYSVGVNTQENGVPVDLPGGGGVLAQLLPCDVVDVAFEKMEFEFRTQKSDQALDAPVKGSYDFKANKQ